MKPGIQTPPKDRRVVKPKKQVVSKKTISNLPSLYENSYSFYKVTKTKQPGWKDYYSLFVQSKPEHAVAASYVPKTKRLAWHEMSSWASAHGIFTNDRNEALENMAKFAKHDGLTAVDPNKKESFMTKPANGRIKEWNLLASTGLSIEAIQKMINKRYYSDQWTVTPDLEIHHPTKDTSTLRVVKKAGRYRFESFF